MDWRSRTSAPVRYTSLTLRNIESTLGHVYNKRTFPSIPLPVYHKLKRLQLLKHEKITVRGTRGGVKKIRTYDRIRSANKNNLSEIKVISERSTNINIIIGCVNVRSVRNKAADFIDSIISDKYDICLVTETWLLFPS